MQKKAYKFGVEIEFTAPRWKYDNIVGEIHDLGCDYHDDGSIRCDDDYAPIEVVTPPQGFNYTQKTIRALGKMFEKYGCTANKSCGVHVHTSNRHFLMPKYIKRIIHTWIALEDVFVSTQPRSRFSNGYCVRLLREHIRGTFDDLPANKDRILHKISREQQTASDTRYLALNVMALNRHGTIECRLHAWTLNPKKINNWITLLRAFYNYCIEDYNPEVINELFKTPINQEKIDKTWELFRLDNDVREFYNAKIMRSLFGILADQQKGAVKRVELKAVKDRAVRQARSAQERLNTVEREESNALRAFRLA